MIFKMICNSNISLFGMRTCSNFKRWRANSHAIYCVFECTKIWRTNLAPAPLHMDYQAMLLRRLLLVYWHILWQNLVMHIRVLLTTQVISVSLEDYFHILVFLRAWQNTGMAGQLFPCSLWILLEVDSTCLKESFLPLMAAWSPCRLVTRKNGNSSFHSWTLLL